MESVATKVSYSGDHSATTTATPDVYISKWGSLALVQHNKDYVPDIYESPSLFHRRSVDVPQDYSTIQAALNAAVSGQTVHVASDTYNEDISISNENISIIGAGTNTVINGEVTFNYGGGCVLKNLKVNDRITFNSSLDNH